MGALLFGLLLATSRVVKGEENHAGPKNSRPVKNDAADLVSEQLQTWPSADSGYTVGSPTCKDTWTEGILFVFKGIYYHNCQQIAARTSSFPNGLCGELTGGFKPSATFQDYCYKTCTQCDDSDDIEVSTKVRPTVTTVASTARSPFAHATTTTCPTTREKAQLCVNQDTDACHAHKCSIPPKCKCHNWETKRNVSGTNGVTCYVCIDTPPTSPPHITRHTKVDMKSVWAALGCGIVLLLSVILLVYWRERRNIAYRSRRRRQNGGDDPGDDDDVAMLVPDAVAEDRSLEEAIKLLPWLADAEQKRAGQGEEAFDKPLFANIVPPPSPTQSPSLPNTNSRGAIGGARMCSCANPKGSKARFCPTCGGVVDGGQKAVH